MPAHANNSNNNNNNDDDDDKKKKVKIILRIKNRSTGLKKCYKLMYCV